MSSRPLLSILIVTYRDPQGVRRTLRSVEPLVDQGRGEIEVIVVDGGTSPTFTDELKAEIPWIDCSSQRDAGIYDGMNRALRRSSGEFVWFLNGGDEAVVTDWRALKGEIIPRSGRMIYGRYQLKIGGRTLYRRSRSEGFIRRGLPTSHQAILYPGSLARSHGYDLSYRISADYAFTAKLSSLGVKGEVVGLELARFHYGGTSTDHARQILWDAERTQREILHLPVSSRALSAFRLQMARIVRSALAYRGLSEDRDSGESHERRNREEVRDQ